MGLLGPGPKALTHIVGSGPKAPPYGSIGARAQGTAVWVHRGLKHLIVWVCGAMSPWASWAYGCVGLWASGAYGCVDLWASWAYGCVGLWASGAYGCVSPCFTPNPDRQRPFVCPFLSRYGVYTQHACNIHAAYMCLVLITGMPISRYRYVADTPKHSEGEAVHRAAPQGRWHLKYCFFGN